jgi:hypothetical protein
VREISAAGTSNVRVATGGQPWLKYTAEGCLPGTQVTQFGSVPPSNLMLPGRALARHFSGAFRRETTFRCDHLSLILLERVG